MMATLHERARRVRARALVRAWDYRQRRHARGAWFRLRRILTDASAAFVITEADARQLLTEGFRAEPAGSEFEPARLIVFAPAERLARIASARAVPVRLDGLLLGSAFLALVPFDTDEAPACPALFRT